METNPLAASSCIQRYSSRTELTSNMEHDNPLACEVELTNSGYSGSSQETSPIPSNFDDDSCPAWAQRAPEIKTYNSKTQFLETYAQAKQLRQTFIINVEDTLETIAENILSDNIQPDSVVRIQITNKHLTEEQITKILNEFDRLEEIAITDTPLFTGRLVNWERMGTDLKALDVSKTNFCRQALVKVAQHCKDLRFLSVAECHELNYLHLALCCEKLEALNVEGLTLPLNFIADLAECSPKIISLNISSTRLNEAGNFNWNFKNIHEFIANETNLDNYDLSNILLMNPSLRILHIDNCNRLDIDTFWLLNPTAFDPIDTLSMQRMTKASDTTINSVLRASTFRSATITQRVEKK